MPQLVLWHARKQAHRRRVKHDVFISRIFPSH
jgi:hypothetical protein